MPLSGGLFGGSLGLATWIPIHVSCPTRPSRVINAYWRSTRASGSVRGRRNWGYKVNTRQEKKAKRKVECTETDNYKENINKPDNYEHSR